MSDEDPVRDAAYAAIAQVGEEAILEMFRAGRGPEAVRLVVDGCKDAVGAAPGLPGQKAAALATVLLHYLCARLLVPAQRKTRLGGVDLDIVVPDTRTLGSSPGSALVICILDSDDPAEARRRVSEASRVQPVAGNIWLVCPGDPGAGCRTFVAPDGSFAGLVPEISAFLERAGSGKIRMFGER